MFMCRGFGDYRKKTLELLEFEVLIAAQVGDRRFLQPCAC
jgi:hypothetical protein